MVEVIFGSYLGGDQGRETSASDVAHLVRTAPTSEKPVAINRNRSSQSLLLDQPTYLDTSTLNQAGDGGERGRFRRESGLSEERRFLTQGASFRANRIWSRQNDRHSPHTSPWYRTPVAPSSFSSSTPTNTHQNVAHESRNLRLPAGRSLYRPRWCSIPLHWHQPGQPSRQNQPFGCPDHALPGQLVDPRGEPCRGNGSSPAGLRSHHRSRHLVWPFRSTTMTQRG